MHTFLNKISQYKFINTFNTTTTTKHHHQHRQEHLEEFFLQEIQHIYILGYQNIDQSSIGKHPDIDMHISLDSIIFLYDSCSISSLHRYSCKYNDILMGDILDIYYRTEKIRY